MNNPQKPNNTVTRLDKPFYGKIKQEVKVLANISFILDKMDKDGYLRIMKDGFEQIIGNEIDFAIGELNKIKKKSKGFDMKSQLTNNTYIFKENLKMIAGFIGGLSSGPALEGEDKGRQHQLNYKRVQQEVLQKPV